ncbi:MAG: hypothetical protein RIE23_07925 [Pontimonas sp.]
MLKPYQPKPEDRLTIPIHIYPLAETLQELRGQIPRLILESDMGTFVLTHASHANGIWEQYGECLGRVRCMEIVKEERNKRLQLIAFTCNILPPDTTKTLLTEGGYLLHG